MVKLLLPVFMLLSLTGCQLTHSNKQSQQATFIALLKAEQTMSESLSAYNKSLAKGDAKESLLPDLSAQSLENVYQQRLKLYQQLQAVDIAQLDTSNKTNHAILLYKLKNQLDNYINKDHYIPLMAESGFHSDIAGIANRGGFKTSDDYQDYLARLRLIPRYFDQQIAWMQKGLAEGISQPKVVLTGFEKSIQAYIKDDATQTVFYRPFANMPTHLNEQEREALVAAGIDAITNQVMPAYQKFYQFMVDDYLVNARDDIAAGNLPNGKLFYQNRVTHYTTTDKTADEIHQIGLAEVARIRAQMQDIIAELKFEGSFADFVTFLRTDPQFYATSAEDLLKEASFIAKKIDAKLPQFFKTLPRKPYGVAPVPEAIAPKYTTGRYAGARSDDQAGFYWVNTYALDRRPLYVLEALTLHEAVPGHHLQISLAKEMEDVPDVRRDTYISAFGEGWALYGEWLGVEMGFYQDLYSQFGRLTYEMWRACRLVVDTGMHVKGWSRQQAIDYLANNTALSMHNVVTEIDRYISWPGQALSYKMGELTIKKLRQDAELALGEKFDLREFHDAVLSQGAIPLSLLEQNIQLFITENK